MTMELRCPAKKHGEVVIPGDAVIDIACDSRFCGKVAGVTVLHRFDLRTGALQGTRKYRNPQVRSK